MNTDIKQSQQPGVSPAFADPERTGPSADQPYRGSQGGGFGTPAESSLKKDGVALKDKAMDRLASEADSRKAGVSTQLKSVSSALHAAEDELSKKDGDAADWLKSGLHQMVSTIEGLAERVERKDSAELIGEVKSFARDNPRTFLAACALAGFAAARLFKAGTDAAAAAGTPSTTRSQA